MLQTSVRVRTIIHQAIDDPTTVPHAMLTRDAVGAVRVWRFVLGSATAGVRLYELRDGTRKRLTAPKNLRSRKKRKRADGCDGPSRGQSKNGGSGEGGLTAAIDAVALRSESDPAAELRSRLRITRSTYLEDVEEDGLNGRSGLHLHRGR